MKRGLLGVAAGVLLAFLVVEACLNIPWMDETPSMLASRESEPSERAVTPSGQGATPLTPAYVVALAAALVVSLTVYAASRRMVG
ncbi:MAG: hypothetical protein QW390_00640 [Candidatus Bathyarchaeia archaeon]